MAEEEGALVDVVETNSEESQKEKTSKKKPTRKWTDHEVETLIDILEQQTCLWDVFSKEYHLKEKRAQAYKILQDELVDITLSDIKTKIIGLRSQLNREVAKTSKRKSG